MTKVHPGVLLVLLVVVLLGLNVWPSVVEVVSSGWNRFEVRITLQHARQAWADGRLLEAVDGFFKAAGKIVDGGVRWQVAQQHTQHATDLAKQGEFASALAECTLADRILGPYDDRNAMSIRCGLFESLLPYTGAASTSQP